MHTRAATTIICFMWRNVPIWHPSWAAAMKRPNGWRKPSPTWTDTSLPTDPSPKNSNGRNPGNTGWGFRPRSGMYLLNVYSIVKEQVRGFCPSSGSLWFRPPFGVTNPTLAKAVRRLGYIPIGWNIRTLDTQQALSPILFKDQILMNQAMVAPLAAASLPFTVIST